MEGIVSDVNADVALVFDDSEKLLGLFTDKDYIKVGWIMIHIIFMQGNQDDNLPFIISEYPIHLIEYMHFATLHLHSKTMIIAPDCNGTGNNSIRRRIRHLHRRPSLQLHHSRLKNNLRRSQRHRLSSHRNHDRQQHPSHHFDRQMQSRQHVSRRK